MRKNGAAFRWRWAARLPRYAAVSAFVFVPLAACGARTGLSVDNSALCGSEEIPILPSVPNLYFVLDTSGSMLDNSKWTNVRSVVAGLIGDLGADARFGAAVFPAPDSGDTCASGVEVMALRLGDTTGQTAAAFLSATALTPQGGTPTAATFRALLPKVQGFSGVTSLILATDGGPNCDPDIATCTIDMCTANIDGVKVNGVQVCFADQTPNCCAAPPDGQPLGCLDGDATAQAIAAIAAIGVPTYVMGIPGSAPYGGVLDQLAVAGGTARPTEPQYYAVDSADTVALGSALREIAAQTLKSCSLSLSQSPKDPSQVNVYVNGSVVPSDGPNGWSLNGQQITVEGAACGGIQAPGSPPVVKVLQGCPTVH
jgi:hypothetical protein